MSSTTNGVKVFTMVVISGSLFFLIYHIGRRRILQAPKPDLPKEMPLNPRAVKGARNPISKKYFSHHYERSYPRSASIAEGVEPSLPSGSSSQDTTGSTSKIDADDVHDDQSTASELSDAGGESSSSRNPYIYSSTDAALRSNLENRGRKSKFYNHHGAEECFLDHLRHSRNFDQLRTPNIVPHPRSPGDLSSFETIHKDQEEGKPQKDVAGPRTSGRDCVSVARTETSENLRGRILPASSILPQMKHLIPSSTSETVPYARPLLYSFIWCILSHTFLVFSTTGMGATMATFPAPFLRITVHSLIQSVVASCMLRWPLKKIFFMSWSTFLWRVIPVAVATTLDHDPQSAHFASVCESLRVPVVSLLTCKPEGALNALQKTFRRATLEAVCHVQGKCKVWVPLIVLLLGTMLKLEGQSHSVFCNVILISVGFMLAVYRVEEVELWSLTESFMGSLVSAFRLATTQSLLQNREIGLVTPVVTMRALAPAMALVTAILSYVVDPWRSLHMTEFFDTPEHSFKTCTHITVGALLETSVALAELVVIYHTSANSMLVVAMLKEVVLLTVSRYHRHDFSRLNAIGASILSFGVLSYNWLKYRKVMKVIKLQLQEAVVKPTVPSGEGTSSSGERSLFSAGTEMFTRTGSRIWTQGSSSVDRLFQRNGSLRIIARSWSDRLYTCLRRWF